jgi:hypothetical protein
MTMSYLMAIAWASMLAMYLSRAFLASAAGGEIFWKEFFRGETGILDRGEALLWIPVIALSVLAFVRRYRREGLSLGVLWHLGLALLCTFLLGEEISWGQHVLGFESSERMIQINAQAETNLHNLNLSVLFGIPPDSALYPVFSNFNHVLNPAYYLLACILWIAIPVAKYRLGWRILAWAPAPGDRVALFLAANVAAYLFVDKLLFDVGEIFELALTMTFLLAVVDTYRQETQAEVASERRARFVSALPPVRHGRIQSFDPAQGPTSHLRTTRQG